MAWGILDQAIWLFGSEVADPWTVDTDTLLSVEEKLNTFAWKLKLISWICWAVVWLLVWKVLFDLVFGLSSMLRKVKTFVD